MQSRASRWVRLCICGARCSQSRKRWCRSACRPRQSRDTTAPETSSVVRDHQCPETRVWLARWPPDSRAPAPRPLQYRRRGGRASMASSSISYSLGQSGGAKPPAAAARATFGGCGLVATGETVLEMRKVGEHENGSIGAAETQRGWRYTATSGRRRCQSGPERPRCVLLRNDQGVPCDDTRNLSTDMP